MPVSFANPKWSRRGGLIIPIALMTIGGLALLVIVALFLIHRFDETALERERAMVEQGFVRQVEQYELVVTPQATWDTAVKRLDHRFDPDFADLNFGVQFYTFNGFTRTFIVDGENRVIYASINGKRMPPSASTPYSQPIADLLPLVRQREAARGPIGRRLPGMPLPAPIQLHEVVSAAGQVFIVIATLVQPDDGAVLPKGPRAPVVFTLMPINRASLDTFAARYLLDGFHLVVGKLPEGRSASFVLRTVGGKPTGALAWTPRRPGTVLLEELQLPLLAGMLTICLAATAVIRRSVVVVDELIASETQQRIAEERLAAQEELWRLNRITLLEAMTSSIAHEVNQPIGAALNYAQAARNWLSRPNPDLEEASAALDGSLDEIAKAGQLIRSIRQLTGRQPREFRSTDLHRLVLEQVRIVHSEFDRRKVRLDVTTTSGGPLREIQVCRPDIAQVVLNLLANALESFPAGQARKQVTIEVVQDEAGWAEIRVIDNGGGISEAHLDMIFNTFFTAKERGTGLGLAICKEIAERHSGSLIVTPNRPNGTIAMLRLPFEH